MFAAPSSPMVAGIQSSIVAVLLLAFGYLLVDAVAWRSHLPVVTRLGLAFPALAGYAFVLQVLHIATAGWVFATPWVVRVLTAVVAAGLVVWKVVRLIR